jgi:hypothetical protein
LSIDPQPPAPSPAARRFNPWHAFKRLTQLGFPPRYPIVQFPNLPLIIAFAAGLASKSLHGADHRYALAIAYLGMTVWAYEELANGVNWFRHLLGLVYVFILVMRVAHAIHG